MGWGLVLYVFLRGDFFKVVFCFLALTLQPFQWTCARGVFSRVPGKVGCHSAAVSVDMCFGGVFPSPGALRNPVFCVVFFEVSVGRLILHVFLRRLFCDASAS